MKKKQVYIFSGIGMLLVFVIAYYLSALLENGMDLEFMERRLEEIQSHPIANYWNRTTPLFFTAGICHWYLFTGIYASAERQLPVRTGIRDCKMG